MPCVLRGMSWPKGPPQHEPVAPEVERIGRQVLDAAFEVHTLLGPGLLERVYSMMLAEELALRGIHVEREVPFALDVRGRRFDHAFRADLVVEGHVLVEVKATEGIHPSHLAQLRTYLRASGLTLGYLLNFSGSRLQGGIRRVVSTPLRDPVQPNP